MSRIFTIDMFKEKSSIVHKKLYDYKLSHYVGYHKNIKIICPEHGEFWQTPANHLGGKGCSVCGKEKRAKKRRKSTTDSFIIEAKKMQEKNKYDYSLVNFISVNKNVKIICPKHGIFNQTPAWHLKGHRCPKCGNEKSHESKIINFQTFFIGAKKIHGSLYKYSENTYKMMTGKIEIFCTICSKIFFQNCSKHLGGQGCPHCAIKKIAEKKIITTEEFIKRALKVHGSRYNYSKVIYEKCTKPVCIICHNHGEFWTKPSGHLNNRVGCPQCTQSKGESIIEQFLIAHKFKYKSHKAFKDCKNINPLIFDFYLIDHNICIEFDGEQHFKAMGYFGSENPMLKLKRTQKNDRIKNQYCKEKSIPLFRISYKNIKRINSILNKKLVALCSGA